MRSALGGTLTTSVHATSEIFAPGGAASSSRNDSTPASPTAAMTRASAPSASTSHAFKRSGATMAALILGYKAPDLFVQNKRAKRTDAIRKGLPDALDLLVICAEAGLTVDSAFSRVSKELGRAYPELGEEFALTSIELGFLTERRQAFENLAYRVDLESVKGVVTTMIQTEKYGTPLASAACAMPLSNSR